LQRAQRRKYRRANLKGNFNKDTNFGISVPMR
jgi:hypothetical protein